MHCIFFFKQKTAYEMRISDWSSDVCSSDLNLFAAIEAKRSPDAARLLFGLGIRHVGAVTARDLLKGLGAIDRLPGKAAELYAWLVDNPQVEGESDGKFAARKLDAIKAIRSEEHTSELQPLMRTSYAVFCLNKQRHEKH